MTMPKFCESCGAELQAGAKFCISCGSPIQQFEPTPAPEPEPAPEPAPAPAPEPEPTPEPEPIPEPEQFKKVEIPNDNSGEETMFIGDSAQEDFSWNAPVMIIVKERSGEKITIDRAEFILGKNPTKTDFAIRDNNTVSRIHACISWKEDSYMLTDLGSKNGTFVNGEKVGVDGAKISNGDIIKLADEPFRVTLQDQA